MSLDPGLLQSAAWALRNAAGNLDDSMRRLRSGVEQQVVTSTRGWKGPAADAYWTTTRDRYDRMRRSSDRMRDLATQMDRAARQIEDEEARRAAAAHR
jgi:WXG100 family type VII secretion target